MAEERKLLPRPAVSVIMPVRDGARYLHSSVESILQQTCRDFEFIVIDDGSRDATPGLLAQFAARDARLRILRQDRCGIVAALNAGLAAASAEFVARMDADDIALPDRLEAQLAMLRANPTVAVLGSACVMIDAAGAPSGILRFPTAPTELREQIQSHNCLVHPSVTMRRSAVLDAGGYRPAFLMCEDFDLWLRVSERHDLMNDPRVLLQYRLHANQGTWRRHESRLMAEMAALACARLRKSGQAEPVMPMEQGVTQSFLRATGLSDREIAREVASRAMGAAEDALQRGFIRAAIMAFGVAMRQSVSWRLRLRMSRRFAARLRQRI